MKVHDRGQGTARRGARGSAARSLLVGATGLALAAGALVVPATVSAQTDGAFPGAAVELWSWNAGTNYEQVFDDAGERFAAANDGGV